MGKLGDILAHPEEILPLVRSFLQPRSRIDVLVLSAAVITVGSDVRGHQASHKAAQGPQPSFLLRHTQLGVPQVSRRSSNHCQHPLSQKQHLTPCCILRCSFAVVIQQLGQPLRDAVCIFYLVLRGLDTVEDDMALAEDVKVPALLDFHNSIYQR